MPYKDPAKKVAYDAARYKANPEPYKARARANPSVYNPETERAWIKKNPEKAAARHKKYRENNRGKVVYWAMTRKASKIQRTPTWDFKEVTKDIYECCPKGMEVDHIIPLRGEKVSGLHVYNNLQYLTKSENSSKGNRYNVKG